MTSAPTPASAKAPARLVRDRVVRPLAADRVKTRYDVKYTEKTVVLDAAAASALRGTDAKNHVYRFDRAGLGDVASTLAPGKVLLIPGKALRTVDEVREEGEQLVVKTSYASLADAIDSGHLGWDAHLSFDRAHALTFRDGAGGEHRVLLRDAKQMLAAPADPGLVPDGPIPWSFEVGPMTYEFAVEPKDGEVSIAIKAIKKQGPKAKLAYTAKGTFRNVYVKAEGTFEGSKVKSLTYDQPELQGDVTLSIAAAGAGLGKIEFPFPSAMFDFVVMVGPVPITIKVGAKLIGNITVPAKASATAKANFRFSSSSGFQYTGSDVDVKGNIGNLEFKPDPFDSAAMIGIPVDAQWGVAFPRISVSVFDSLFVPYIHAGVVVGSALKRGPICKYGYVKYVSEVGYDFKIFGVTLKKDKVKIAEREERAPKGGCPKKK